jgi:TATA-binding protein-associated factor
MGRLANIHHFLGQAFADEIANDAAELRRAKQDDPSSMRALQVQASRRMQLQFAGALIRRSVESKDFNGDPLLDLPEKTVHYVHLQLKPWELEFVDQALTQEAFEQ